MFYDCKNRVFVDCLSLVVHHAKNANENNLVFHYAPIAAKHAASVGSHLEAAKLF